MSDPAVPTATPARITPRHYRALCGLALVAVVLMQMQQSGIDRPINLIVNALVLCVGAIGILDRARFSPVLVLLAMAAPHFLEQRYANQLFHAGFRDMRFLDVADVLTCMAALTYFIGHYRLLGLWAGLLPSDARVRPIDGAKTLSPHFRSGESLTAAEVLSLVFTVPTFALLAEFACLLLNQQGTQLGIDPRWNQFLLAAWTTLLGVFLIVHAFRYWRRLQMDRVSALLMMQDMLWHETRGEQRRIQRWLTWKKLRARKE